MSLSSKDFYRFDDFELQPSRRLMLRNGERVPLAPKTFEVLFCLVTHAGHVVLKEDLLKAVWPESFVEESNLTQHIFWLRKALADKSGYIETIVGRGYEFTGEVTVVPHPEPRLQQTASFTSLTEVTRIVVEETTTVTPLLEAPATSLWRTKAFAALCALVLVALAGWGVWRWVHRIVPGDHHKLVLAELTNSTGDPDFDGSLKALLSIDLEASVSTQVGLESDVRAVLKRMKRPVDQPLTRDLTLDVCREMEMQSVVQGSIAKKGSGYVLTLSALDCGTGKTLTHASATSSTRDGTMDALDLAANSLLRKLGLRPFPQRKAGQARPYNFASLRLYSEARNLQSALMYRKAAVLFEKATKLSPNFAAAFVGLGQSNESSAENGPAIFAITRANELREQMTDEQKFAMIAVYERLVTGDLHASLRNYQQWAQLYPVSPDPWLGIASTEASLGHLDKVVEPAQRAVQLAPINSVAYTTLAVAHMRAGELDAVKATCREALRRGLDNIYLHILLLEVAWLQHDVPTFEAQHALLQAQPDEPRVGELEFSLYLQQGKVREALALERHLVAQLKGMGGQHGDARQRDLPRKLAELGYLDEARRVLEELGPVKDHTNVMIARAETGESSAIEPDLEAEKSENPTETVLLSIRFPEVSAAIALARHRPEEAIADLVPAIPFDLADIRIPAMRGRAYLAANQPASAELEFRKILDHPGIDPVGYSVPLAQLGLARAEAMEGNHEMSKREYETLFMLWKDADKDFVPLLEARAEYAKLR